jgi:formylmethanofuran dehydrogenase subunit D
MTYARLENGPLQWPCNDEHPDGCERLYTDGIFSTAADYCETFGHDLVTGGLVNPVAYKAQDPQGRAILKAADYQEPHERPDDDYPFWLTTGRVVYHFHTRTKTARSPALNAAAPDAFVQLAKADADSLGIADGDMVEVASRRGRIQVAARVGEIIRGHVFVPFHYGDWDRPEHSRAANELTITEWDAVSKQPHFKYAAVSLAKVSLRTRAGDLASSLAEGAGSAVTTVREAIRSGVAASSARQHVASYLALARQSEEHLAESLRAVAEHHGEEPDIYQMTQLLASWSAAKGPTLDPLIARYGTTTENEPEALHRALFHGPRSGGLGLVRDLHDLWLLTQEVNLTYEVLTQAARGLRDEEMKSILRDASMQTHRQADWLRTRVDQATPQALTVPS